MAFVSSHLPAAFSESILRTSASTRPATFSSSFHAVSPRHSASKINMTALNPDPETSGKIMKELKDLPVGSKIPVCRCWQSAKFPMCDGSHNKWNKENGDNLGPFVVTSVEK